MRQPQENLTVGTAKNPPQRKKNKRSEFYENIAQQAKQIAPDCVVISGYKSAATASNMRKGRYPAIDPGEHDIDMHKEDDGTYTLYLRYTGVPLY